MRFCNLFLGEYRSEIVGTVLFEDKGNDLSCEIIYGAKGYK